MNLTGKELVAKEIVTGLLDEQGNLKQEYTDNVQQHGVDLNLIKVERIDGPGFIPLNGKTKLAERTLMLPAIKMIDGSAHKVWKLSPGAYDITFAQGCIVPPDQRLEIVQRSSVLRNAGVLRSSVFDAGFTTKNIGTVIIFHEPILIEVGARVAQIVSITSNAVENLYNGQWQNDKQRETEKSSTEPAA